jgi:hypothetical protein
MGSDQRDELLCSDKEGDRVHDSEEPQKYETGDLIGRPTALNFNRFCFHQESILSRKLG